MSKPYGRQQRDRQRRESRAQWNATTQAFYEPPSTDCTEVRQEVELDDPDFLLSQRLVTHDSKLVEYAIVLSRNVGGQWVEVYSVDTKHGVLHEHRSGHRRPDDRRDVQPLYTQVELQESFDEPATRLVMEKYRRMRS